MTWSICAATTIDGWVCHEAREGYFKIDDFIAWLHERLFPTLRQRYLDRTMVIVIDNLRVHVNKQIPAAIEEEGYIVRYLPPYLPDFNPIELMWAVLKA